MKKTLRNKWVEALRSDKYEQGIGRLKQRKAGTNEPQYCCLGVLCELMEIPNTEVKFGGNTVFEFDFAKYVNSPIAYTLNSMPPLELQKELKIDGHELANMNDNYGRSFNVIADYIEQNVPVEED